ncbi:MAG TPA: sugar ABC transporter permease [Propionibacteriaceae bacterium]|nr:sugar ABC transporter permease [Propionibacteriaceae bacterium]
MTTATLTRRPSRSGETPRRRHVPRRVLIGDIGLHLGVLVALLWAIFPLVYILSAALNPSGSLDTSQLFPTSFSLTNFRFLFTTPNWDFPRWMWNSLLVCFLNALIAVFIGSCAAFAFSRLRFRGRRAGLAGLLLLQMFPATLAFVALYITFSHIGDVVPTFGLNSVWGLILAYAGGAMGANVWLLKGYFDTVPKELDEAAIVDGATHARTFFTIVLPLVAPILVTVFMLSFIGTFSEFLIAGLFLQDNDKWTVAVGLYGLLRADRNKYFGPFCAGAMLSTIPVMVLYFAFQRQLTGGLTAGSVK